MNKKIRMIAAAILVLGLAGVATSCQKGPAEKVGEKIDKAVDNTKEAVKDAKDDITKKR